MSGRNANEKRYKQWIESENGGRIYTREIPGQYGWYALYIKEVDADEAIVRFRQEIYDETGNLVEIHEKYPVDTGHRKIEEK